ncbi:MAG: tRNA 2-thiouridine(34) synthase MnmA [Phycisphaerales bacterium]|nr:tRNA 2-thiouridine(34) synthase MnmA [Phycisphaerales bacterium]
MPSPRGKVLLAMSGGVDSSVAAALLLREGYEVVGCFMRLGTVGESLEGGEACAAPMATQGGGHATRARDGVQAGVSIKHRGCCSVSDAADARMVAGQLGIPFYVCNFKQDFGRIIDYFVEEYGAGRTPNPCVRCNDWLKFGKLHDYARELGCGFVASGHYARVVRDGDGAPRLARGVDAGKDQSYVLFGVGRERLGSMLLPIGEMRKADVRALAAGLGLPVFDKPDSQEICFVPDDDYAGLLERRRPGLAAGGGEIVDTEGVVLGRHGGQHRFTIGQRRKVGVALGRPIYVVERDPVRNRVVVGDEADLMVASCVVGEAAWLIEEPDGEMECLAQFRSNGGACGARVRRIGAAGEPGPSGRTGRFEVEFASPCRAVSPGQALVLYDGDGLVLGGGWIASTARVGAGS